MCAFVVKEMEEKETIHLNYYLARQELWTAWKNDSGKLELLLQFFHSGFCELFNRHAKGKGDKFSQLLVEWHQFVGSLACSALQTKRSRTVWLQRL